VKCWGDNSSGQLGIGDLSRRGDNAGEMGTALPAIAFPPQTAPFAISAGADTSCALFGGKTLRCWGMNTAGQAGIGDMSYDPGSGPGEMSTLPTVDLGASGGVGEVSGGGGHICALLVEGDVKCWGFNESGQLGLGDTRMRGGSPSEMGDGLPAVALGSHHVLSIASGAEHSCALLDDHTVKCWGENGDGQLGQGDKANRGTRPSDLGDALPPVAIVE
jgi:alpha-tubulin suppressor-like RCC1 family protein